MHTPSIIKALSSLHRAQLIHRDKELATASLISEGYRKVGEINFNLPNTPLFVHFYNPHNGNRLTLRIFEDKLIYEKHKKIIKQVNYECEVY